MDAEYSFRVVGRLTPGLVAVLEPLETSEALGDTVLVARVADRAALHGFIARIEGLGLELVELHRRPPAADRPCPACGRPGSRTGRAHPSG